MFYFATINIQGWYELKPSIWVFVTWCVGLFMFFFFISLTEWLCDLVKINKRNV